MPVLSKVINLCRQIFLACPNSLSGVFTYIVGAAIKKVTRFSKKILKNFIASSILVMTMKFVKHNSLSFS